jgi:hypothetical protein
MTMDTNTQGVIAQVRAAAAPQQAPQQPAPVQPAPTAQPAPVQPQAPQGFGAPPPANGFAPAPVESQFVPAPVQTDNTRTAQQFEKLTDSNQRLAQQIQDQQTQNQKLRQELEQLQRTRQQTNQQFQPAQQPAQPVAQQQPSALPKLSDYINVDPVTGQRWVDEDKFNSDYQAAAQKIFDKATRAEETVQRYVQTAEQREVARQESEAFGAYPQLNPRGGSFDARLSQQTRAIIYDSMINPQDYPGQRPLTFKEAADFVSGNRGQQTQASVPTPTVNAENALLKQQAATTVPSVPQQAFTSQEQEEGYKRLVEGTRTGSDEAIAIRLKNATHRLTDVERELAGR